MRVILRQLFFYKVIMALIHFFPVMVSWYDNRSDKSITERMSIFSAYHLPDQNIDLIYDSITPVNSFRLILNAYFNANYELLEDKSYFSYNTHPYNFTDVTEILLINSTQN